MPYLLDSICTIIGVFHKYAQQGGDCSNLNRREMKTLIQTEFAEILENPGDPQIVELTFQLLDVNRDSLVDFNEYLVFIFQIAKACYSYLQLREYFPQGEGSKALDEGQPGGHQRHCGQLQGNERKGDSVQERRDSGWTHLPRIEEIARGEMKGCSHSREPGVRAEDVQRWDSELRASNRRIYPSHEHKERETEEQAQRGIERWQEQQREDVGCGQLKQQESADEEGYQRKSQDHLQRHGNKRHTAHDSQERDQEDHYSVVPFRQKDERLHQAQETDYQEAEENLIRWHEARGDEEGHARPKSQDEIQSAFNICCPSCQHQEWEDGRKNLDTQGDLRSCDLEHRVADKYQDQMRNHTPVDDHEQHCSLPREGRRSREAGPRESEHSRQQSYLFQSREDEQRANQARNQELRGSERRRDEDDWIRPHPREAARRPEVEDQPRRHDLEHREQERSRLRSSDLGNTDRVSRRSQSHDHESRGGVRRSQWAEEDEQRRKPYSWEETQETDNGRRRPQSSEPEPRNREYGQDSERRRPQPQESAQRENHQGRHQYYEMESWDGGRDRRRPLSCYSDPRKGDKRRPQLTDSRDEEQQQLQTRQSVTNPTQQQRFSPPGTPEEHEWSRQRKSEPSRPSEQREGWRQRYDRPTCCQRKMQLTNIGQGGDRDERTTNFCDAETRDVNQRQTQAHAIDRRETEQQRRMSSSRPDERDVDQRWAQTRDGGPKDVKQQRTSSHASDAEDIDSRDTEEQRKMPSRDSNSRAIDQRRTPTSKVEPKEDQLPRRMPPHDSSAGDGEQRWIPTQIDLNEVDPRGGELQSRAQAQDHDFRDVDQREIHSRDSDPRDLQQQLTPSRIAERDGEQCRIKPELKDHFQREAGEQGPWTSQSDLVQSPEALLQRSTGTSAQPCKVTSLTDQARMPQPCECQLAEGLLREQRPSPSGNAQLPRKPQQSRAEQSKASPGIPEQMPTTRGSQCLSGPEEGGAPRRWLLPRQPKAQGGEEAREQQRPVCGLAEGQRATSEPQEQQTAEGHQSRAQPKPASPGKGDPEGPQAGKKDQAQEPAGNPQQQLQTLPSQGGEGDQPEMTEPKMEGADGRGPPRARESQPPLEQEEDRQTGTEKPGGFLHERKASGRSNPLYEYLLAQKKPEQS